MNTLFWIAALLLSSSRSATAATAVVPRPTRHGIVLLLLLLFVVEPVDVGETGGAVNDVVTVATAAAFPRGIVVLRVHQGGGRTGAAVHGLVLVMGLCYTYISTYQ